MVLHAWMKLIDHWILGFWQNLTKNLGNLQTFSYLYIWGKIIETNGSTISSESLKGLPDRLVLCFSSKFGYTFLTVDQCSVLVRWFLGFSEVMPGQGYKDNHEIFYGALCLPGSFTRPKSPGFGAFLFLFGYLTPS